MQAALGTVDKRLGDQSLVQLAHDIECGSHSGIPPCCIAWFVLEKRHWQRGDPRQRAYDRSLRRAAPRRKGKVGYAPCPTCIAHKRFVAIRVCDCANVSLRTIEEISCNWRYRQLVIELAERPQARSTCWTNCSGGFT